mgnify:CR=1 FL=1
MTVSVPPWRRDQTGAPAAVYFATTRSSAPIAGSTPPPKSAALSAYPVTTTFPSAPLATACPASVPALPARHAHGVPPVGGSVLVVVVDGGRVDVELVVELVVGGRVAVVLVVVLVDVVGGGGGRVLLVVVGGSAGSVLVVVVGGGGQAGVVTGTGALGADSIPTPSRAMTANE